MCDYLHGEQLEGDHGDIDISRAGLCAGHNEQTIYGLDGSNGEVIRIDIRKKQCPTVFESGFLCTIKAMCCLRGNSTKEDILTILIQKEYPPQKCKLMALEESNENEFEVGARCKLQNYSGIKWKGVIAQMKSGVAVIQRGTSIIQVWQFADPAVHEFNIPDGDSQVAGMCSMENVLGKQELLALAFSNKKSIEFYAIELNGLVKVRNVLVECDPFGLLWLEGKQTLFIGDNDGNVHELCAMHVSDRDVTSYKVKIDDKESFEVLSWCVLLDKHGNEKTIALFDYQCNAVKIFDLP